MQLIQPKLQELQKKYKNDKEKLNMAVMDLYKKYNVNPMAGCLPVLIQIPILISLFRALSQFTFEPLEHATFLWVTNLSNPDPYYILPVLVGLATFLQSKLTTPSGAGGQQAMMLYFMPLFIGWVSMKFPAGLCLYWVVFNTLGVIQQAIIIVNRWLGKEKLVVNESCRKSAKTVEEAIELALTELDLDENQVEICILEQPTKGFLVLLVQKCFS